jgi:hypothetical protein
MDPPIEIAIAWFRHTRLLGWIDHEVGGVSRRGGLAHLDQAGACTIPGNNGVAERVFGGVDVATHV